MINRTTKPTTLIALRHGGTHLIQPLIRHLTDAAVAAPKGRMTLGHIPAPKVVVFTRDPRNRIVSHFRYKYHKAKGDPGSFDEELAAFIRRVKDGQTNIEFMTAWAKRWVGYPGSLLMRFETVMADQLAETERLKEYLGAPGDAAAACEYTFGKSGTWTGRHSNWREWFGPRATEAWEADGGRKCLKAMGYK